MRSPSTRSARREKPLQMGCSRGREAAARSRYSPRDVRSPWPRVASYMWVLLRAIRTIAAPLPFGLRRRARKATASKVTGWHPARNAERSVRTAIPRRSLQRREAQLVEKEQMVSGHLLWNRNRLRSSRASIISLTRAAAAMKPISKPFWHAARPKATWTFPCRWDQAR